MANDFPPPKQQLRINDNSGYGGGAMGGGFDPQALQQMLAAALAQSGGALPPPNSGQHSIPNAPPPQTWQDRAYNAPRVGGEGSTPHQVAGGRGLTPSEGESVPIGQELGPPPTTPGSGYGGMTPMDQGPNGRSPYIIDRIPDQPPVDRSGMPVPIQTDPAMFGGQFQPIDNQMPFGFNMGGLFGG